VVSVCLYCTDEPNDADLLRTLGSCAVCLPIASGDVCFSGKGTNGSDVLVCCERKKIGDMVSCIQTGRYLHQLQIAKSNNADIFVLILEGRYRRNPEDGLLEIPIWGINPRTLRRAELWEPVKPTTQFSRFDQYLTELARDVGVILKHTENVRGTADVILALYQNFQTPSDQHQSLRQIFNPAPPIVQLVKPSLIRRVACELPGISWVRSQVVIEYFQSVRDMVNADWEVWASLKGIGKKTAQKVVKSLGGMEANGITATR